MDLKDILVGRFKPESHKSQSGNCFQLTPEDHMPPAGEQYFTPRQRYLQKWSQEKSSPAPLFY